HTEAGNRDVFHAGNFKHTAEPRRASSLGKCLHGAAVNVNAREHVLLRVGELQESACAYRIIEDRDPATVTLDCCVHRRLDDAPHETGEIIRREELTPVLPAGLMETCQGTGALRLLAATLERAERGVPGGHYSPFLSR